MCRTYQFKLLMVSALMVLASCALMHAASAASKKKGGKSANNGKKKGKRSPPPRLKGEQRRTADCITDFSQNTLCEVQLGSCYPSSF